MSLIDLTSNLVRMSTLDMDRTSLIMPYLVRRGKKDLDETPFIK